MKLRIKGNSLRFRVTQSELARFLAEGRIAETIYFSASEQSRLTYALQHREASSGLHLAYHPQEVTITVPEAVALKWANGNDVGVYGSVDLGVRGTLELMIEKDFACLDLSDAENADTFPNPSVGAVC